MRNALRRLRYLLVWPAISAYRRRARRSLRWRLGGSYLLMLFVSLAAALVFIGLLAALGAAASDRAAEEPADDARAAARVLSGLNLVPASLDQPASPEVTNALKGMASGGITIYRAPDQTRFDVRPSSQFKHVRSISVVDSDGRVWASSDPALVAAPLTVDAQNAIVIGAASDGSTNLQHNSRLGRFTDGARGIGAYPLVPNASASSVVFVEKSSIVSPGGGALWWAEVGAAGATFGITALILFIPGLIVATLFAVRSARAIVAPLDSLNDAARALAAGDLTRRVQNTGEDEVAALANSFDAMAARLAEAMDGLAAQRGRAESLLDQNRQLVANVSHELRTPVAIIRGHIEALAETSDDAHLPLLLAESARLEELIDDLFRAASNDAEPHPVTVTTIDAAATLREAVEPLVAVARREAGVTLVIDAPATTLSCLGDATRLVRVLQNLVRNALRHTPEGGIVLARAAESDDAIELTVSDSGEGIADADLPHVFERFYQGGGEAAPLSGAGLGLAIARQFVEAMGGSLAAANDHGAVFTIRLPRAPSAAAAQADAAATTP
jgi:signal transduction histidine kinase